MANFLGHLLGRLRGEADRPAERHPGGQSRTGGDVPSEMIARGRHGGTGPDDEQLFGFLYLGQWWATESEWIEQSQYDLNTAVLRIQIKGGAYYERHGTSKDEAEEYITGSSRGVWCWRNGWRDGQFTRMTAISPQRKRERH